MGPVYFLGGFPGSQISAQIGPGNLLVYVDNSQLMLGHMLYLGLAADGSSPGPPPAKPCVVGPPLPGYYGTTLAILAQQLAGVPAQLIPWGWDWRKELFGQGQLLADQIATHTVPGAPCTLVGHSTGGLVALCAWIALQEEGQSGLIRRIITLGSPLQGTYYPQAFLSDAETGEEQLVFLNQVLGYALSLGGPLTTWLNCGENQLGNLFLTFPAFYELMPSLLGSWARSDQYRAGLFQAGNYPSQLAASQDWLDFASSNFWPALAAALAGIPSSILTTVAGVGYPTFYRLDMPAPIISAANYVTTTQGDGVVVSESAQSIEATQVQVVCQHSSIPQALAASGQLLDLILASPPPDQPPPPLDTDPTVYPALVGLPPGNVTPSSPTMVSNPLSRYPGC